VRCGTVRAAAGGLDELAGDGLMMTNGESTVLGRPRRRRRADEMNGMEFREGQRRDAAAAAAAAVVVVVVARSQRRRRAWSTHDTGVLDVLTLRSRDNVAIILRSQHSQLTMRRSITLNCAGGDTMRGVLRVMFRAQCSTIYCYNRARVLSRRAIRRRLNVD